MLGKLLWKYLYKASQNNFTDKDFVSIIIRYGLSRDEADFQKYRYE